MARYLCDLLCHFEVLTAPFSLHTGTLPRLLLYWGHDRDKETCFISLEMGSFVLPTYEMLISQNQIIGKATLGGQARLRLQCDVTQMVRVVELQERNLIYSPQGLDPKTQKPPSVA